MQTLIDALSLVNVGVPVYLIVTAPSVLPMAERGLMQGRELRPFWSCLSASHVMWETRREISRRAPASGNS